MSEPGGKGPLVVCMGEALIDFVAQEPGPDVGAARTFVKSQGGAMANVAMGLARLGAPTRFIAKVGADPFGRFLRREFAAAGVDGRWLSESADRPTGVVFVNLDRAKVPSYVFYGGPSADMELAPEEVGPEALADAAFLHLGTVSMVRSPAREASLKLVELARARGVKVSFDPNLRLHLWKDHEELRRLTLEVIARSDLLKLNELEQEFLTGDDGIEAGARKLLELGPKAVVTTRGEKGAYYSTGAGDGWARGFVVEAVDTMGAGDGFAAGLLRSLSGETVWPPPLASLARAVDFANAVAALVVTDVGAVTAMPDLSRALEFQATGRRR